MAINWTPARLEVDLNYKSKDIVLASEWNNLWKETRLQGNNNTDGIVLLIETVEGNVTHLTNLDNLFSDLESKVTAHTGNSDIHVTALQKTAWTAKYDKPSGGIPKSDLASNVQSSLEKADTALQQHQDISVLTNHVANNNIHVTADNKTAWNAKYAKPTDGIPKIDLASAVQTSLNKADTALQEHQDISDLVSHTQNSNIHVTSEQKTAWSAKYDKPAEGIPKSDLASSVQTSLNKVDTALQELQDISALTSHVANNDIHVATGDKTAWNAKAEVFTITFSHDENENPTIDKTFDEIASAFNNGKTLRLLAGEMFEGELVYHTSNQFSFIFVWIRTIVTILPSQVIEEDADMYLPSANTSDAGKMLMVNSSGNAVWAEATSSGSSGSSGAEVFLVTFTQVEGTTPDSMSFTADKTYSEIVAAHEAGKIVRCSASGIHFGQLVSVRSNYVVFGVDYLSTSSSSAKYVFTIRSDDSIAFTSLCFYDPVFLQWVISANAWSDSIYSFESDFANMFYDIEVELDSTATNEQLEAWSNAKPTAVFGTNTMKALGDIPTVDIPVIVKVLFNAKLQNNGGEQ